MSLEGSLIGSGQSPELDKIIKLFTGPNSASLHERHYASIERLCNSSQDGFALKDLPKVQQIIELTLELLKAGEQGFLEPACTLCRALGRPFVKKAATDEIKLLGNVESILTAMGKALDPGFPEALQHSVAEVLRSFATAYGPRPSALELAAAIAAPIADSGSALHQYLTNQSLILRSGVARAVIKSLAMAIVVGNEPLVYSLSVTLLSFSFIPSNCGQMVAMGIVACIPNLLSCGFKNQTTSVAVELLWNLLEKYPETKGQISVVQPTLSQLVKGMGWERASGDVSTEVEDVPVHHHGHVEADQSENAADVHAGASSEEPSAPSGLESYEETGPVSPAKSVSQSHLPNQTESLLASALSTLFLDVLGQGFRETDKELRNNVMVVINLVLDASSAFASACFEAGLFKAILAVSCAPEFCDGSPYVKPWALTTEELDLELKLLCWNATTTGCVMLTDVLDIANQTGLVPVLLQYLDVMDPPPAVLRWNVDRSSSLRSAALTVLRQVAPLSVEQYLSYGGVSAVLTLLANCLVPVHVEAAVRHLHKLVEEAPEMAEALGSGGSGGIVPVVLDLVLSTAAAWPESLRQAALQLLALLCSVNSDNRRRFRKAQGVQALVSQLSGVCLMDPSLPSILILAVLNVIWSCIIPDRKNVALFLVSEGLDLLLNLLETGNKGHRPIILGVLADMLENPKTHQFFHEWRSDKNQQSAAHMLICLWQEEDSLRGMTVDGIVTNTHRPLVGLDRRTKWIANETVMYGNMLPAHKAQLQAIMDAGVGDLVLSKIYAVLKVLGMGSLSYLSLEDQSMLCMIEKYVKFRQGEMWRQIKLEFEIEGMRPTAPDRERLVSGIELSEHLAQAVRDTQQQLIKEHTNIAKQKESKFFEDALTQRQYEKDMRFYQKDKSQMTLAEIREAKKKKERMLKDSLKSFHFMDSMKGPGDANAAALNAIAQVDADEY